MRIKKLYNMSGAIILDYRKIPADLYVGVAVEAITKITLSNFPQDQIFNLRFSGPGSVNYGAGIVSSVGVKEFSFMNEEITFIGSDSLANLASGEAQSTTLDVDFTNAEDNTVYTVPTGKKFYPKLGIQVTDTITGSGTQHSYKWMVDAVDLMPEEQSSMVLANDLDVDGLDAKFYPAGSVVKLSITTGSTYTTHTGKAILQGVLANV